ncbi:MAG: sulfurtransferase TusA family protein [Desulfobacterales bacterium]|nr:sulfurtransferase TusA family protein [Desulfobacterales bacterium]
MNAIDTDIKADEILDARGLSCPMPMLKTKKALKHLQSGQILEVLGTDPGSKNDIPDFCQKGGNTLLEVEDVEEGYTRYLIQKG